jgi:putative tryptophan/tyrosine transport system substrate-binding protein
MRRRKFIALVGSAAAWPSVASGQESARARRVGVLMGVSQAPYPEKVIEAFRAKLNELGWVDGQNLRTETRWAASDVNKAQVFARELVQLTPDLLVAHSTISVAALLRETRSLPIVFFSVSDPIGSGFVASLSSPGGNVTGFLNFEESLGGKWLQLLKDIIPKLTAITTMQHLAPSNQLSITDDRLKPQPPYSEYRPRWLSSEMTRKSRRSEAVHQLRGRRSKVRT